MVELEVGVVAAVDDEDAAAPDDEDGRVDFNFEDFWPTLPQLVEAKAIVEGVQDLRTDEHPARQVQARFLFEGIDEYSVVFMPRAIAEVF